MYCHQLFPNKCLFWLGNIALARNFWDFRQLKVPQNPLEPAKCIFWNRNCHHRFDFFTLECAFEASKTTKCYFYERKSRASEDFFYFGQLKVLFKVTFIVKHISVSHFWNWYFDILVNWICHTEKKCLNIVNNGTNFWLNICSFFLFLLFSLFLIPNFWNGLTNLKWPNKPNGLTNQKILKWPNKVFCRKWNGLRVC